MISTLIYNTLRGIVETYPVLADVEESKQLPLPYAVYRLRETGNRTKETVKKQYDVGVFVVCDGYERCWEIIHSVESAVGLLNGSAYSISVMANEVKYDGDDRCYVGEMSFTIKKL